MPSLMFFALVVLIVVLGAAVVVAYQERDGRQAMRRARGGALKFAGGVSLGLMAVLGIFEGLAMGASAAIGDIGGVLFGNPSFVVDLGLIGWGAFALVGPFGISLGWFLIGAVAIVGFGLALRGA